MIYSWNKVNRLYSFTKLKALIILWGFFIAVAPCPILAEPPLIYSDTVFDFKFSDKEYRLYGLSAPIDYQDQIKPHIAFSSQDGFQEIGENRYGVMSVMPDNLEIYETLLSQGLSVLNQDGLSDKGLSSLISIERTAKQNKTGLWKKSTPSKTAKDVCIDCFAIVSGTIVKIHSAKTMTYLNFGDDWKTDLQS